MIPFCAPDITRADARAVAKQVASGWVGPGETGLQFTEEIVKFIDLNYVVMTTSGTTALQVAAHAIGLARGGTVLVPAYGPTATANAFRLYGMNIRYVDIDRLMGCMCPDALRAIIDPNIAAVCFVNFSGYCDHGVREIDNVCKAAGVPLIEDAACALGHKYLDHHAGTFGRAGILSFSPHKLVTTGQGGAVVLSRYDDYERACDFIDQGDADRTGVMTNIGGNMRMSDINAALGLSQMKDIERRLANKRRVHQRLSAELPLFKTPSGTPLHNIIFARAFENTPSEMCRILAEFGIDARLQYKLAPEVRGAPGQYPGANWWDQHAVYLPFGTALNEADAERIADAVLNAGCETMEAAA